jgi:hypothetical protein
MSRQTQYDCRWPRWWAIGLAACLGVCAEAPAALAVDIVRVEEEWELKVATPDPGSDAPQITCVFSPIGDISSLYAVFEVNQRSLPSFSPGGMQLQLWYGDTPLVRTDAEATGVFHESDETVTWTQLLEVSGDQLRFAVVDGHSETWGDFGGDELKIDLPIGLANLNQYDPQVSVRHSAVGYASNRVKSLTLKRVRIVARTGETAEDTTVRVVHALP